MVPQGIDQAIDRHRGEMAADRTALYTEAAVGGQQDIAGDLGSHLAVAQDEVWQDREYGLARGALDPPDHEPTQPDTGIVRVARQAVPGVAARFVEELKAEGEEKGEDELDKRPGVVKELVVSRFIVKIHGDRAVFACHLGDLAHVSSPCRGLSVSRRHGERNPWQKQAYGRESARHH